MSYFLAVDVGATKTDYLLADESRELARVRTPTIKRMRTDAETATLHLDFALTQLSVASGVSVQSITRTCIGTAGETIALVTDWLRAAFHARVSGELLLLGDVEIALDAAFPGQPGVVAIAGTGSNVAGRTVCGALTTAGGWGPALADQGSGHRIGHQALRALFLAVDEGRETQLRQAILDLWQLPSLAALIDFSNQLPAPDFSRLTELVLRCAEGGDNLATSVLQEQGEELAHLVSLVIRRLRKGTSHPETAPLPPVAFAGSIMEKVLPVRHALIAAIEREFPGIRIVAGVVDPLLGALWRARAGIPSTSESA